MQDQWAVDPTYSHGYLVPLIAVGLLGLRRDLLVRTNPSSRTAWMAVLVAVMGGAIQFLGSYLYVRWLSGASLLLYLSALALWLGGWRAWRWAAPAIAFLVFMIPLPYRIESAMRQPLRQVSTKASCFVMQAMGLSAVSEGNIILLNNRQNELIELGVVDACSGLKMFIVFLALSTAVALVVRRPLLDRLVIFLSAAPIAVVCNVARISLTGWLYANVSDEWAEKVFHDFAGWLMMPMALGLLWLLLQLLSWVIVDDKPPERPSFVMPGGARA